MEVGMYPNNQNFSNAEWHSLDMRAQVGLEKHQRMIHDALEWQRLSRLADKEQKQAVVGWLQLARARVINLLTLNWRLPQGDRPQHSIRELGKG
jgi:hypothetical protein